MFKVGDKVKCVLYGKGRVRNISACIKYPLDVEFDSSDTVTSYTMDGRVFLDANPTLKHRTPKFKVGDRVKTDVWGEGVVDVICESSDHPIMVEFELEDYQKTFTKDGRFENGLPISLKKIKK